MGHNSYQAIPTSGKKIDKHLLDTTTGKVKKELMGLKNLLTYLASERCTGNMAGQRSGHRSLSVSQLSNTQTFLDKTLFCQLKIQVTLAVPSLSTTFHAATSLTMNETPDISASKGFKSPQKIECIDTGQSHSDYPVIFSNALLSFKMSTTFLFLYK